MLYRTAATGLFNGTPGTTITTYSFDSGTGTCVAGQSDPQTDLGVFELSPYITPLTNYGFGFVLNAGLTTTNSCKPDGTVVTNPPGGIVQADAVTLMNSPIATACFACHDGDAESAHMRLNGGSLYQPRSVALAQTETCMSATGRGRSPTSRWPTPDRSRSSTCMAPPRLRELCMPTASRCPTESSSSRNRRDRSASSTRPRTPGSNRGSGSSGG